NNMRTLFILLFMLSSSFTAMAQTGFIVGHIVDSIGNPIANTSISLIGTDYSTISSNNGYFYLKPDAGNYSMTIHSVGKKKKITPVSVTNNDTTKLQSIRITERNHKLNAVTVSGFRENYNTKQTTNSLRLLTPLNKVPQNIQVITAAVLEDRQVISMKDGIIRDVSGATRLGHWDDYTRINMRGARASEFRNGFNFTSNWGPLTADMSMVERIEFVKGPAGFMMSNGEPGGMF